MGNIERSSFDANLGIYMAGRRRRVRSECDKGDIERIFFFFRRYGVAKNGSAIGSRAAEGKNSPQKVIYTVCAWGVSFGKQCRFDCSGMLDFFFRLGGRQRSYVRVL